VQRTVRLKQMKTLSLKALRSPKKEACADRDPEL
jgi:hypothetical protein